MMVEERDQSFENICKGVVIVLESKLGKEENEDMRVQLVGGKVVGLMDWRSR